MESERDQLRDLFHMIHARPDIEAQEIFRRLRTSQDPLQVLRTVVEADTLFSSPGPASSLSTHPQVENIDSQALRWSSLKLRARPWTDVAGDGLVSSLISSFFAWDGFYLIPLVDVTLFTRDMNKGDVDAKFCSPFLVNAICCIQVSPGS